MLARLTPAEMRKSIGLNELAYWDMLRDRQTAYDDLEHREYFYGEDEHYVSAVLARAKTLLARSFCAGGR